MKMIFPYTFLLSVSLSLIAFSGCASAAFGDVCTKDSDCAAADFTTCQIPSGCVKGTCSTCITGYVVSSEACKKDYGISCADSSQCATDICSASVCACATGETWDSLYLGCYTIGKGWGTVCVNSDVDTDCSVLAIFNGACMGTDNVCDCGTGYYKSTGYVCRRAQLGEICDSGDCSVKGVAGTASEVEPICMSGTCACNANLDHVQVSYEGETYCTDVPNPTTKLKTSDSCNGHNQCESGKCYLCPDTTGSICIGTSNSDVIVASWPLIVIVPITVAELLHV